MVRVTDQMASFLERRHSRLMSTQMTEDLFNRQKRQKYKHLTRKLKVARAWGVTLEKEVAHKVHHYDKAPPAPPTATSDRLPDDVFAGPLRCEFSERIGEISSFKADTAWHSPPAERMGARFADSFVLALARQRQCWESLDMRWLGCLADASHRLLLRQKRADGSLGQPVFAARWLATGVAFGWPAREVEVPGHSGVVCWCPETCRPALEDMHLAIMSPDHWVGRSIEWKSPASQFALYPEAGAWTTEGVRAYAAHGDWQPLLKVAAAEAFWSIGLTTLKSLSSLVGARPADDSMFSVLSALVQQVLQCSEEECVDIVKKRVATMDPQAFECADALIELDAAVGQLDPDDVKELRQSKDTFDSARAAHASLASAWRAKKAAIVASRSGGGGGRSRSSAAPAAPRLPKYPAFPNSMLSQPEAAALAPPGAAVWVAWNSGAWASHVKPFPRRSFAWAKWGHEGACRLALEAAWRLYLQSEGLPLTACLVQGLFAGEVGRAPGASSSSSGSGAAAKAAPAAAKSAPKSAPKAKATKRRAK